MRILKGWTEEERKELEEAKDTENLGDFLHAITEYRYKVTHYHYVWDKYDKAKTQDQFSIIQDIVDFYFDKAKFSEQKYYWKFNELTGRLAHDLYLSIRVGYPDTKLSDENCGLLDPEQYHIMKFTKSDVDQYLMDNTNLDINNFTPVEADDE